MRNYSLSILCFAVAVGLNAFIVPNNIETRHKKTITIFFIYIGNTQSVSDRSNPSNYQYQGRIPYCMGSFNECAVEINVTFTPAIGAFLCMQPAGAVTYNTTNGYPNGGSEFISNKLQP